MLTTVVTAVTLAESPAAGGGDGTPCEEAPPPIILTDEPLAIGEAALVSAMATCLAALSLSPPVAADEEAGGSVNTTEEGPPFAASACGGCAGRRCGLLPPEALLLKLKPRPDAADLSAPVGDDIKFLGEVSCCCCCCCRSWLRSLSFCCSAAVSSKVSACRLRTERAASKDSVWCFATALRVRRTSCHRRSAASSVSSWMLARRASSACHSASSSICTLPPIGVQWSRTNALLSMIHSFFRRGMPVKTHGGRWSKRL